MNCVNCGHPLTSEECEYCGTFYPNFPSKKEKPPENKKIVCNVCGGDPVIFYDHDIDFCKHCVIVGCLKCKIHTKHHYCDDRDLMDLNSDNYKKQQFVIDAMKEFDAMTKLLAKDALTPNEIRQLMRSNYGCNIYTKVNRTIE